MLPRRVFALLLAVPLPAVADTVVIDRTACRRAVQHVPAADVAFQSGVDVAVRPVAPADLSPAPVIAPPAQVTVALTVPLELLFPQGAPRPFGRAELSVGQVTVDTASGLVSYNGQPLGDPDLARLSVLCQAKSPLPAANAAPK